MAALFNCPAFAIPKIAWKPEGAMTLGLAADRALRLRTAL